jgi:surface antigen
MLVLSGAVGAQAKPPRWAPAHGWRSKHDPHYVGYRGHRWPDDYGVRLGRCNRAAIGAVVGGSVGGAVGSTIGKGDDRVVAVLVGTIVGAVIGHEVGRRMDDVDRSCVGHALELAALGQTVRWTNPETDVAFALTPVQEFEKSGRPCREFQARTIVDGSVNTTLGKACRARDGSWNLL